MKNLLMSTAIGDIAGSAYEGRSHRIKDYESVELFSSRARFTDDTVCTFACAEAFIDGLDMAKNLWDRCNNHPHAGYGHKFRAWLANPTPQPYLSLGNGSAMRSSAAGWLSKTEEQCIEMATLTANPTHNHPEGIKGAIAAAVALFHLNQGKGKDYVKKNILAKYYPEWASPRYADFHDGYTFDSTCPGSVGPAIICFLESTDYVDYLKLAISLGGDADTLAAISGPMAYAYYKTMPEDLVAKAKRMLPKWMLEVNDRFDRACQGR